MGENLKIDLGSLADERLAAALDYSKRGWPVIPLHSIKSDGRCSCGSETCSSQGKHPRTRHGLNDATVLDFRFELGGDTGQQQTSAFGLGLGLASSSLTSMILRPSSTCVPSVNFPTRSP